MEVNNKQIIKNTAFLYTRMFLTMGISLYTSRVILDVLGAEDFGIYNIVGSVVVLFSFLSNALTGASQRFFSYELGLESKGNLSSVFSACINVHIILALIIFVLGETIGLYFVCKYLVLPEERYDAALVAYHLSLITFLFNLLRIPFNAIIISYERMSFFAFLSIVECVLKLVIVYLLLINIADKLIAYSLLLLFVVFIITSLFGLYSIKKFPDCVYSFRVNRKYYISQFSFLGWYLCGNFSNVVAQQGGNIVINMFYGVIINAAYGIANQISSAINNFVSNFQLAFRPQIVKLYASGQYEDLYILIFRASRFSFYLLVLIAVPYIIHADILFSLWLKSVPDYSVLFSQLLMLYFLIDAIQAPLWMLIDASGRIKIYSIWLSFILLFNIPVSYVLLKNGFSPISVIIVRVVLNFCTAIVRTYYIKGFAHFPYLKYCIKIIPCVLIFCIALGTAFFVRNGIENQFLSLLYSILITIILVILLGTTKEERVVLIKTLKSKL